MSLLLKPHVLSRHACARSRRDPRHEFTGRETSFTVGHTFLPEKLRVNKSKPAVLLIKETTRVELRVGVTLGPASILRFSRSETVIR